MKTTIAAADKFADPLITEQAERIADYVHDFVMATGLPKGRVSLKFTLWIEERGSKINVEVAEMKRKP